MIKSIGQSRLLQQMKSMVKDKSDNIFSQPLQNDLFIWHFTILGPQNTDFHEGIYHGQIVLPFQYPFKPPDIYFFTKNGRFEVSTKICLTITQFHPEEWNAGWTIRTMLQAVISLFNEYVPGVGFLDLAPELRKSLAEQSKNYICPKCGPVSKILNARKPLSKQMIPRSIIGSSPKKLTQKQEDLQQINNKIHKYQSASMELIDEQIDQQLLLLQIEIQNKRKKEKQKEHQHKRIIDEMAEANKIQFQNYFENNNLSNRDKGLKTVPIRQIPSSNLQQHSPPSRYSNKNSLASRIQKNMKIYQYAANLSNLSTFNN